MNKNKPGQQPDDDIRGLFSRFGGSSEAAGYQDFASVPLPRARAASGSAGTPAARSAGNAQSTPAPSVPESPSCASASASASVTGEGATPLAALFRRLMEARSAADSAQANPLKRIVNGR